GCDGGDRDEPEQRDLVRHEDRGGGRGGRDLLRVEHRQGGDGLHPHGDGRREHDEHSVQYHGRHSDATGVQRAAEHHNGRGGDHAGGRGHRPGCERQYGQRVHREHHGGDRDEPEHRDLVRHQDRGGGRGGRDLLRTEHRQGGDGLHPHGDGRGEYDERGVQHYGRDGDPAGVQRAAEHHDSGRGDHARGPGDRSGWQRQYGDRVHGECDGGDRDEPEQRDLVRHEDRGGGRGGHDLLRVEHRQGGDGLHPHGDGRREHDEHSVQYHGRHSDATGVQRAAEHHNGRGGDHAGGRGHRPGCERQYGQRVHREHHGGDRDEPEHRDLVGHQDRGGGRGGRDLLGAEHRQGGDGLHPHGDGRGEYDERGVQHYGRDGDPAGVQRAAEHHDSGSGDHARGPSDRPGREREYGDRVHGECDGGDRDEPEQRDLVRHEDRGGGRGGHDLLRVEHRQGGDGLHPHGDGRREHDEHSVQYHGRHSDATGVQRAAEHHNGRGGDHAGGRGHRPGCERQYGQRVHREHHGGDRDEPEHRDLVRHQDRGGRRGGRDLLGAEHRQGGDGLHPHGDGRGEYDERGVQHYGRDGDPAGVQRAAEHHDSGRGDHARGPGDRSGWQRQYGDRVHGECDGGDRDEPEQRDL